MSEDRVEKAAEGIESSVVSLTARLQTAPDGEAMEADLRLLEALLFAAVENSARAPSGTGRCWCFVSAFS